MLRYLDGETSAEENAALLAWLKEDQENLSEFNALRQAHAQSLLMGEVRSFDCNRAFSNFKKKVQPKKVAFFRPWMQVAAAIFIAIACCGVITNFSSKKGPEILASASKEACQVKLEDGTTVTLQPNSVIMSKDGFGSSHRKISMRGEAFFNVKHDASKPFIIKVNKVTITDIGTAFYVKADSITKQVSIAVKQGIVAIKYAGKIDTLRAGDFATTNVNTKNIITKKTAPKANPQKNANQGTLNFKDTPLPQVLSALKQRYNVSFSLKSKELKNSKLNASFESNMSIKDVETILGAALNANVEKHNGIVTIEKLN